MEKSSSGTEDWDTHFRVRFLLINWPFCQEFLWECNFNLGFVLNFIYLNFIIRIYSLVIKIPESP